MERNQNEQQQGAPTVSQVLGEIAWLFTQSPMHRALPIDALEWLAMPAIIHRQFYIFRDGERPVGVALWARCTSAAEKKLEGGLIEAENRLTLEEWNNGDHVWLVDLVAPFANEENRHREIMIADLIAGPLVNIEWRFHQTDPQTGARSVQVVPADSHQKLVAAVEAAVANAPSG